MCQLRYLVCMWLIVQGQYLCAQDQVKQDNFGADSAPIASQTPQSGDEVRPLVDPLADQSASSAPHMPTDDGSLSAALPWTSASDVPSSDVNMPSAVSAPVEPATPVPSVPVIGAAPQVPTPNVPADIAEKIIEPKGIDTVDIKEPEGNWLFKRIWWEKSKEVYGKIRERVDKIVESRMHFFKERVKLARDVIDPFYVEIGLDQGALQESVFYLLDLLKKDQDREETLSAAVQEKMAALQEAKAAITKLGESVSGVTEMDKRLDDALEKLMNQINLARSYESEAWQRLDQIAEELNDKKAREHYYAIATLWRNVKDIANYIQGPFAQHFIQLAQASVQNVQNVKSIADLLQQKGFALKDRIELSSKEEIQQEDEEDDEYFRPKKELGWGVWIWDMISAPFSWIAGLFGL